MTIEQKKIEERMNKTIDQIRKEYLKLEEDQERADFLYQNNISGGSINLSPNEYPKATPKHKPCKYCGGTGAMLSEYTGSNGNFKRCIKCLTCGKKTATIQYPTWDVWRIWDSGDYGEEEGQISLFEYINSAKET